MMYNSVGEQKWDIILNQRRKFIIQRIAMKGKFAISLFHKYEVQEKLQQRWVDHRVDEKLSYSKWIQKTMVKISLIFNFSYASSI